MYSALRIRGFKTFRDLQVDGFQRVNLISGKNNAGKTALLEALFIHSGGANIQLLFSIEAFRGIPQFSGPLDNALLGLFYGLDPGGEISFLATDKLRIVRTSTIKFVSSPVVLGQPFTEASSTTQGSAIELTFSDPTRPEPQRSRAFFEGPQLRIEQAPSILPLYHGVFVGARALDERSASANRFSEVTKSVGEAERLVTAMQAIEPRLRDIRLINHAGVSMMHADVGLSKYIPLAYVGEGMSRLASILVSIASSKNGAVFIDELENGFHYSVLPKLWEAVSDFAQRYNTQLFASTHSEECIRAAHRVFDHQEYTFRLFRLTSGKEGIEAKAFDREALDAALKSDLETR